jgi:predicted PurR-regulated permease PerM
MTFLDRRAVRVLFTILVFALALAAVYVVRAVIIIFAFSILFAYLINPVVRSLQRHALFFKNLRGPHVVEAYLAFIMVIVSVSHGIAPQFHRNVTRLLREIPALGDRVSTGEIANDLGSNLGWTDTQATRIRSFLQEHRATIASSIEEMGRFASTAVAGILVIPILAIFFLSDGENLANQVIRLVSTKENYDAMRSLAGELHVMLQHYIRAKVILGGLSLSCCTVAMLLLGFPSAVMLGILAGILEFIPVAGWMIAAATIVSAGALAHAHWIWMLLLLLVWRVLMDYWIAPRVMGHELEIHPLLAIFTLMVGGSIGGIVGIYLSVPLVATLRVIYRRFASDEQPWSLIELTECPELPGGRRLKRLGRNV